MVAASDFGYIPTVVFVAYLGGKVRDEKEKIIAFISFDIFFSK